MRALSEYNSSFIDSNNSLEGQELPCHVVAVNGSIVTVQFDMLPSGTAWPEITIPVFGPEYIRYPIQVGDKGVTAAATVSLRGVSGLGVGVADMTPPPSLTALYFMPLGNVNWDGADPEKIELYGPKGAVLRTKKGDASVDVETGAVTAQAEKVTLKGMMFFDGPITQQSTGEGGTEATMIGPVTIELDVTASGISLVNHTHDVLGVQSGGSTVTTSKPKPS